MSLVTIERLTARSYFEELVNRLEALEDEINSSMRNSEDPAMFNPEYPAMISDALERAAGIRADIDDLSARGNGVAYA